MLRACYVSKYCVDISTGDYIWGHYFFVDDSCTPVSPGNPAGCSVWGDEYDRGFHLLGDTFYGYQYDAGVNSRPPGDPTENAWPMILAVKSLGNVVRHGGIDYTLGVIAPAPLRGLDYVVNAPLVPENRRWYRPMPDSCGNYVGIRIEVSYPLGLMGDRITLFFLANDYPWYVDNNILLPAPTLPPGYTWTTYTGFLCVPIAT